MASHDELETLTRLGGEESVCDLASLFGEEDDDDDEDVSRSTMPPPKEMQKRKTCSACGEKYARHEWGKEKFKGPLCKKCDNLLLIRLPWLSPADLIILLTDSGKKVWWLGLISENDSLGALKPPKTKETVNKRITNRLQITGGGEIFLMSEACNNKVPTPDLEKITFMGKTYYGLRGKLEKAPAFLHVLPQTLIDIEHCFALDDGDVTVETCQQKELFHQFSKLEKVADRQPPQRSMQELLDVAGLTWQDVPGHLLGPQGVEGVQELPHGHGRTGVRASPAEAPSAHGIPGVDSDAEGEEDEDGENSEEAETKEEAGGRLGNAFEDTGLQGEGTNARGKRGRRRMRRRGRGAGAAQRPDLMFPTLGKTSQRTSRVGAAGLDALTAKAQGIVQASREQLKSLRGDNWSQLVTEGNANAMRKEVNHFRDVFASGDSELSGDLESCSAFYDAFCPFMTAWRLHRGVLPDEVMMAQFDNLEKIRAALGSDASGDGWAPGLAYIYEQAKFLVNYKERGVSAAIAGLSVTALKDAVRRQTSLFKEEMTSEEVVRVTSSCLARGVRGNFWESCWSGGVGECGVPWEVVRNHPGVAMISF